MQDERCTGVAHQLADFGTPVNLRQSISPIVVPIGSLATIQISLIHNITRPVKSLH